MTDFKSIFENVSRRKGFQMNVPKGRGPKRQRAGRPKGPYEPSPRDLEIYAGICEGRTTRDLGNEYELSHRRIRAIRDRVDDWLIPQWMEQIRRLKSRHSESLMFLYREAVAGWRRSQEDVVTLTQRTGNGSDAGQTTSTHQSKSQAGHAPFLTEARAALADIRKIWGADAPVSVVHSDEDRVAGRPRQEVIREQIEVLSRALDPSDN